MKIHNNNVQRKCAECNQVNKAVGIFGQSRRVLICADCMVKALTQLWELAENGTMPNRKVRKYGVVDCGESPA